MVGYGAEGCFLRFGSIICGKKKKNPKISLLHFAWPGLRMDLYLHTRYSSHLSDALLPYCSLVLICTYHGGYR